MHCWALFRTTGEGLSVPGFGYFVLDEIRGVHIEKWKDGMARLIDAGAYSPTTINSWLSILRVVSKAAAG
ncbi:MAG TPA: hypothetical protein VLC09_04255 [Polyangiaceae bacterium]|nr:hypothetical protein [Polyangiaceae bacterium]